ncbi:MAG TPA: baseplate assembly protein [Methylocystis sp.]|jgi:hypothetical protein
MRTGIDRNTGELLTGWDECAQSINVIVSTAIGSLVLNRDFGSDVPALQDRPQNRASIFDHFMAIAEGLRKDEPGYRLRKIQVDKAASDGLTSFVLQGDFYPNGHLGDYSVVETGRGLTVMAALS